MRGKKEGKEGGKRGRRDHGLALALPKLLLAFVLFGGLPRGRLTHPPPSRPPMHTGAEHTPTTHGHGRERTGSTMISPRGQNPRVSAHVWRASKHGASHESHFRWRCCSGHLAQHHTRSDGSIPRDAVVWPTTLLRARQNSSYRATLALTRPMIAVRAALTAITANVHKSKQQ